MKIIALLSLSLILAGCTVDGNNGRFQRTGFPGVFDPGATVILDTETNKVYVGFAAPFISEGAGVAAAAAQRPSETNVSGVSNSASAAKAGAKSSSRSASKSSSRNTNINNNRPRRRGGCG